MPGKLKLESILQSKFERSQRYEDWPSSAWRIIVWHENSSRLFVTLFTKDKCVYSDLGENGFTPLGRERHTWQ